MAAQWCAVSWTICGRESDSGFQFLTSGVNGTHQKRKPDRVSRKPVLPKYRLTRKLLPNPQGRRVCCEAWGCMWAGGRVTLRVVAYECDGGHAGQRQPPVLRGGGH